LSPIYFYGLHQKQEPVLIFTLDGRGDTNCASVKIRENGVLKNISMSANNHSLGFLWSLVTA
jgi:predicted NodU family carbamoyl transferase